MPAVSERDLSVRQGPKRVRCTLTCVRFSCGVGAPLTKWVGRMSRDFFSKLFLSELFLPKPKKRGRAEPR